jgi:hypothetical protein
MTLTEQLMDMADKGAVLGFRGSMTPESLGLIRVDEAEKRLFFMRRWAQGTGDVHIFRWGSYDRNHIFVNFYRAKDGELKATAGPYNEFPEIDPAAYRINLAAWKKELAANRDQYEGFLASQCEELKDAGDDDYIAAVDDREGT